jgi:hypothetical protein
MRLSLERLVCILLSAAAIAGCAGAVTAVPRFGAEPPPETNPPANSHTDSWTKMQAFQVFDWDITPQQATADASRYDVVWGTSMPAAWKAGNAGIVTSWYAPFDGDFTTQHDLAWWKANHGDWVLYRCDRKTPAGLGGLKNVPLDISNPAVVRWQMSTYAPGMESNGYDALAEDLVGLNNANGGCGVFVDGKWVQRFTGQRDDDAWSQAVLAWHRYAYSYLHGLSRPIMIGVNHVPENRPYGDPEEQALLGLVDFVDDESSFTDYGNGYALPAKFSLIVLWMKYTQALGKQYAVDDKWNVQDLTDQEFDWALATYLMGKYHHASVFIDHLPGYGYEYWYPQYRAEIGSPCADMQPDPLHADVYSRKYSGGFVIVNASPTLSYVVTLPRPSYRSIDGVTIRSPLYMAPDDSNVLLANDGCD